MCIPRHQPTTLAKHDATKFAKTLDKLPKQGLYNVSSLQQPEEFSPGPFHLPTSSGLEIDAQSVGHPLADEAEDVAITYHS